MRSTAIALSFIALSFVVIVMVLSVGAGSVYAHHGRGDTYSTGEQITIHGVVKDVRWRNPHIAILVDVTGENGEVTTWTIEHSNVSTLARLGYGRNTLRAGMEIDVDINPGTGGVPVGLCRGITLEDGTRIFLRGVSDETPGRLNPFSDAAEGEGSIPRQR